jgi:ABC-type glycerol-3-phosphate transport system substrate-binding protein
LFRQVVTVDGVAYAVPNRGGTYVGILYSKSLVRRAGLDAANPPRTWEQFARWCRKLYDPKNKVFAAQLLPASWAFAPWGRDDRQFDCRANAHQPGNWKKLTLSTNKM